MVAVIKDSKNTIIAKTDNTWKGKTFYTAPVKDLSCPSESGTLRSTSNCNTSSVTDGSSYFALHWEKPNNWMGKDFDDSNRPSAMFRPMKQLV